MDRLFGDVDVAARRVHIEQIFSELAKFVVEGAQVAPVCGPIHLQTSRPGRVCREVSRVRTFSAPKDRINFKPRKNKFIKLPHFPIRTFVALRMLSINYEDISG